METESPMHRCPRCGGTMKSNEGHSCGSSSEKKDAKRDGNGSMDERIRVRAYELFVAHGRQDGHALDDWAQAEKEPGGQAKSEKGC